MTCICEDTTESKEKIKDSVILGENAGFSVSCESSIEVNC